MNRRRLFLVISEVNRLERLPCSLVCRSKIHVDMCYNSVM